MSLFKTHNPQRIKEELSKLQPSPYNKFFWWRKYKLNKTPISTKASIPDKIKAGYYNFPNAYFWGAQQSLMEMNEEYDKHPDYGVFIEKTGTQKTRYKRLMDDFYREENIKLERIVEDFTDGYILKKEQVIEIMEKFGFGIEELYIHFEKNYKYPIAKSWKRTF